MGTARSWFSRSFGRPVDHPAASCEAPLRLNRRAGAEEEQGRSRARRGGKKQTCPRPWDGPSEPLCLQPPLFPGSSGRSLGPQDSPLGPPLPAAPLVPQELREGLGLLDVAPLREVEVPMPGLPVSSVHSHPSECPIPRVSGLYDKRENFWKISPLLKLPSG